MNFIKSVILIFHLKYYSWFRLTNVIQWGQINHCSLNNNGYKYIYWPTAWPGWSVTEYIMFFLNFWQVESLFDRLKFRWKILDFLHLRYSNLLQGSSWIIFVLCCLICNRVGWSFPCDDSWFSETMITQVKVNLNSMVQYLLLYHWPK